MPKCLCPLCTSNPAPTYTPEFRLLCEARYIARFSTDAERREYLNDVSARRGEASAESLRTLAWQEIRRRSASTTTPSETSSQP
jgi:hypothetical protein